MAETPEDAARALGTAIAQRDAAAALLAVAPGAWPRRIEPIFAMALKRDQKLDVTGAATVALGRASVPCMLIRFGRGPGKLTLLAERDATGDWRLVGAESEVSVIEAWRRGYVEAGMTYKDLPISPLGVAIGARLIAAAARGGDIAAALGDDSPGGFIAAPLLSNVLLDRGKRVSALPSREHTLLGRVAVGFELTELGSLGSEQLWLVLEDHGKGAKVLATVSYMSLAMVLADHGTGLPTPVPGRTPAPPVEHPAFGDAFERAVIAAATAAAAVQDDDDLFARAVKATATAESDPWAALTAELELSRAAAGREDHDEPLPGVDAPDPIMATDELVRRVREAIGGYLRPFSRDGAVAVDPGFVRDHAQGLVGAAFQAIAPILRKALGDPSDVLR